MLGEQADYQRVLDSGHPQTKPFDSFWSPVEFARWATVREAMRRLGVAEEASILDVGCGQGWTSLFLAEAGYDVLGVDFAPAAIELARIRAERWQTVAEPRFEVADMDTLDLDESFDFVLVYGALHHSLNRGQAVARIARHIRPGAWALFSEPSWLHSISPHARRVARESGWVERGVPVRGLKRDCRVAGLGSFRRFFEGVGPYESRMGEFSWHLVKFVAANFAVAPRLPIWLAAQR